MSITQEQIKVFQNASLPLRIYQAEVDKVKILKGKEAVVKKVTGKALKWYARLDGKSIEELREYANQVKTGESQFLDVGVERDRIPESHFFIAEMNTSPQLFAMQEWVNGRSLNKVSLIEIIKNRKLRHDIASFFEKSGKIFNQTRVYPDLMGGETIKVGKYEVEEPTKFIWPLRSTNIMVEGDSVRVIDARALSVKQGDYKYEVARAHHYATLLTAKILRLF